MYASLHPMLIRTKIFILIIAALLTVSFIASDDKEHSLIEEGNDHSNGSFILEENQTSNESLANKTEITEPLLDGVEEEK